jgi:hypothetical protein
MDHASWRLSRGGPLRTVFNMPTSLEHAVFGCRGHECLRPGLGIVMEQALAGGMEVAKHVRVTG